MLSEKELRDSSRIRRQRKDRERAAAKTAALGRVGDPLWHGLQSESVLAIQFALPALNSATAKLNTEPNECGQSALEVAVARGNAKMVGMLISQDADVLQRDSRGRSLLNRAAQAGQAVRP